MSPYLAIFAIPVLAVVAGVLRRSAPRPDRPALAGAAIVGVAFAVLAATTHDPDVPFGDAVFGVAAAGLLLGALPPYLFFVLGRALCQHRITLGLICMAVAVPVAYYYLVGWILVLGMVHCPPDAYECPL
jgi:hypothetical protein